MAVGYNECMRDMLHVRFLSKLTPSLLSGFMFSCHFVHSSLTVPCAVELMSSQSCWCKYIVVF